MLFIVIFVLSFFSQVQGQNIGEFSYEDQNISTPLNYSGGVINTQSLSVFETLMTNKVWEYITSSQDSVSIDVTQDGQYFSSLRDVKKNYTFTGEWYLIKQQGIGEVFIDTTTVPEKTIIFSFNTPLKITLTNTDGSERYTDIFLHPRMYLVFQPSRGNFLKNADSIRVQTVYSLGYFWDEISQLGSTQGVLGQYDIWNGSFLQTAYGAISSKDETVEKVLEDLWDQKIQQIWGLQLMQRYIQIFINDQKKKVFYKNMILQAYLNMINAQEFDEKILIQLRADLEKLKELDINAYNEMILLQDQYTSMLNSHSSEKYIIPKILFAQLDSPEQETAALLFPLSSFSLFSQYNNDWTFSQEVERTFLQSFWDYNSRISQDTYNSDLAYQYFSYLLEQQLITILKKDELFIPESFIAILKNHIDATQLFYTRNKNTRISTLYIYNDILEKIEEFLRSYYFREERNEAWLLEYVPDNRLNGTNLASLKKEIYRIFELYDENKQFLSWASSRDRSINTWIINSRRNIWEYLAALQNYESYVAEYDESKKNLLNLSTLWSIEDQSLTEEKLREYFSQFEEVSLQNATIRIQQDFYEVEQVYIRWKIFNFNIYPDALNRLQDISINSISSPFIYKLDNIESEWEERYKTASIEDKENYDFKKFFILTFFSDTNVQVEDFIVQNPQTNEDKTEIVFKRDILLGQKWEFVSIRNILPLEYENISVRKNESLYDIFIESAPLSLWAIWWLQNKYEAVLDSRYILNSESHYFEGMKIRVYSGQGTNIFPVFDSTQLQVLWRVQLTDFSQRMTEIFTNMDSYSSMYSSLRQTYAAENIIMQFSSRTKKMTFKFDLDSKSYNILMLGDNIESIYSGTTKIATWPIELTKISQYLK